MREVHLKVGRYLARFAADHADIARAQGLRDLCFRRARGLGGRDADRYDATCRHMLVEEVESGELVCCYRVLILADGAQINTSYSAQFYDLARLSEYRAGMIELGRFCIHPDRSDPDILRLAWGALACVVDAQGVGMLFGCSSFDGAAPEVHAEALDLLARAHLAPERWRPGVKAGVRAALVHRFAQDLAEPAANRGRAMLAMPPLLRSYLSMGGWVSDHAVLDPDLNTLHVFTGLEIAAIPPGRARLLRAGAGDAAKYLSAGD